jgi:hypothetical protein
MKDSYASSLWLCCYMHEAIRFWNLNFFSSLVVTTVKLVSVDGI